MACISQHRACSKAKAGEMATNSLVNLASIEPVRKVKLKQTEGNVTILSLATSESTGGKGTRAANGIMEKF